MAAMTPRERWLAVMQRQTPDCVPTDFWSTPEVYDRLLKELECKNEEALWKKLDVDHPRWFGPTWKLKHHPHDPQAGMWGTRSQRIDYGTGSYGEISYGPLAAARDVADVHRFGWPSVDDFDYSVITTAIRADDGYRPRNAGNYEPFLLYCQMRGLQQAFEDLLVEPEIVEAGLGHIFDFYYEHNRRIFEAGQGKIDFFYLGEDLGSQTSPLMSLAVYRRFLMPNQIKMADLCRHYGVHVFYHTDGAARQFLPDLVDHVGVEILNPIQWRCPGMERQALASAYGDRLVFHGAVDNQQTLPFGTCEEVRLEVRQNMEIFGVRNGGRYVCAPCHNLQPVTPTANILALYQAAREYGQLT